MEYKANRRQVLWGIGAVGAALTLPYRAVLAQTTSLRIGTSSSGSVFYTLAIGAGELIRKHAGINTTVEPVGGSAANVNGIANDNVDVAITNSFAAFSGYNAAFGFADKVDQRLLLQGNPSYRWIFTRPGAGIETAKDLEGRTIIGERRALPELRLVLDALSEVMGLDQSTMNIVATTETNQAFDAIRSGAVDAFVMPYSPNAAIIEEGMRDGVIQFLRISPEERDAMLEILPSAFFAVNQRAGMFSNEDEVVPLVSLSTNLIAQPSLDDETAYLIAKTILENTEEFATYHATGRQWTAEATLVIPAIPWHDGAIRYFQESGLWTEAHQSAQERLLGA
jgi:TRAP transporter TAXI family solute receptor